jgi:Na+/H+ antiporter NhaD/arsenite permease-like protein
MAAFGCLFWLQGRGSLAGESSTGSLGAQMPPWSVAPFAFLLLGIAILPLLVPHWWEHNRNKAVLVLVLSLPIAAYLVAGFGQAGLHELEEKVKEYVSFVALLGSLFVISGGICIQGSLAGTPLVNTLMIGLGGLTASFIGTTGASMLLIRPLLKANHSRQRQAHVVIFFIFVVSNCGGLLTPLGDPPLFLGFLNGVPFEWTLRLWPQWLAVNGALLAIFHVWDQVVLYREERERPGAQLEDLLVHEEFRIRGLHNLAFLAGVVAVIYASGRGLGHGGRTWPYGIQETLMLLLAGASYLLTSRGIRHSNRFSFSPILEVAVLFAGIFVTMTPALLMLNAHGPRLGLNEPWQFFWATGGLSSFLDNAPTYLTFAAAACGMEGVPLSGKYLEAYLALPPQARSHEVLAAISCGAVLMGANTYIGNGPNFMVKAIAEEHRVRMPGFFGYMVYSGLVLLPLFAAATWLFFV